MLTELRSPAAGIDGSYQPAARSSSMNPGDFRRPYSPDWPSGLGAGNATSCLTIGRRTSFHRTIVEIAQAWTSAFSSSGGWSGTDWYVATRLARRLSRRSHSSWLGRGGSGLAGRLGPFVRLGDELEMGRGGRLVDTQQLELHAEEVDALEGVSIEPVEHLPMLVAETRREPHNHCGVEPGGVGQELAEMRVVGRRELVLYSYRGKGGKRGRRGSHDRLTRRS
jgi:hypothetical protein